MGSVKTAYDISRKQVYTCDVDDPVTSVAATMHTKNVGSIIVENAGKPVGIITTNGILRNISARRYSNNLKARDIMSSPIVTVHKDTDVEDLVENFRNTKVSRMVLTNERGKIVGVVRDIAVYKYMAFCKFDKEVNSRFTENYLRPLY